MPDFAAVEIPQLFPARQMLLAPLDKAGILVDDELDAVGHGFQAGQGHHAFHGSGQHVQERLQPV